LSRLNFAAQVIPAKAGIQSVCRVFPSAFVMDSRFRGNDGDWEIPFKAHDSFS